MQASSYGYLPTENCPLGEHDLGVTELTDVRDYQVSWRRVSDWLDCVSWELNAL